MKKQLFSTFFLLVLKTIAFSQNCEDGTFWTLEQGVIKEWQLNNNVVSGGSVVISPPSDLTSLSYCGSSSDQTFYGTVNYGISYYTNPGWNFIADSTLLYANAGGYKQYQYYMYGLSSIYFYNGSSFTLISPIDDYKIADIGVDTMGRAWTITEDFSSNLYLKIIDSSGAIMSIDTCSQAISLNNAYGSFVMRDTLYIGLGYSNPNFPNSILPVIRSGTSFHFGPPVATPPSFANPNYLDMANCNGSKMPFVNILENSTSNSISIYPNPFTSQTTIAFSVEQNNITIKIIDILGKEIKTMNFTGKQLVLDKGEMTEGIYFVQTIDGMNTITNQRRIVIE